MLPGIDNATTLYALQSVLNVGGVNRGDIVAFSLNSSTPLWSLSIQFTNNARQIRIMRSPVPPFDIFLLAVSGTMSRG